MKRCFAFTFFFCICLIASDAIAQDGRAYAFDVRTRDNFLAFTANDPGALEFINKNVSPFALDFDTAGTTLYAIDSNVAQVGTMDQVTGQFTSIGLLSGDYAGGTVTGLSCDPTDGTFYMTTTTQLFTVAVDTGATVLIGDFLNPDFLPAVGTVIDVAINSSGQIFIHSLDPTNDGVFETALWSVSNSDAESTLVGFAELESSFAQGMDFDPDTDTLYAAIYTGGGTGSYGTWDTTTAAFTEILDLPSFGPVELEMAISGGTTYAYDFRGTPDSFITFPLNSPLPFDSTADVQNYASFAMDFDDAGATLNLFDNGSNFFGTINTDNGCFTPVAARSGDLGVDPDGMSCDPSTGMFWLLADNEGDGGDSELYTVDVSTGVTTLVSVVTDGGLPLTGLVEIAFDNDGNLYAFDIATDSLYSVVPMSGVATLVGAPGVGDANFAQGMDFDPVSNTLYQAIYTGGGTGSYGSWDLPGGSYKEILPLTMFLDPIGGGYELELTIGMDILLGDINCDGIVSLLDVAPFVALLTDGGFSAKADFNGDGVITLLDVAGFVDALTGA